jgi:copper chaperone CopZ
VRIASQYVHALDGRLRIKVAEVRNSPATARRVEETVGSLDAVQSVTANPTTGNVLVLYEPGGTSVREIVAALQRVGCLRPGNPAAHPPSPTRHRYLATQVAQSLARATVEVALQEMVRALL